MSHQCFFFNHSPSTVLYTLSLHDALPISAAFPRAADHHHPGEPLVGDHEVRVGLVVLDRKSTRLNSSHVKISYAVFCLKKKKENQLNSHMDDQDQDMSDKSKVCELYR